MGLLDQLWDDTVAGPAPRGKLRKYNSFSPSSSSTASSTASSAAASTASGGGGVVQVTRSISIFRTLSSSSSSAASSPRSPSSPASAPDSPFSPTSAAPGPWADWKRLRRKPTPTAAEGMEMAEPRSPTVYDWVVISSLDK